MKPQINWDDFEKLDIRVGTIVSVDDFPEARKPAFRLRIDFGATIGVKQSSAQITVHYQKEDLQGKQVIAVINFAAKRIAGFMSECLVLGIYEDNQNVILLSPERAAPNGAPIG